MGSSILRVALGLALGSPTAAAQDEALPAASSEGSVSEAPVAAVQGAAVKPPVSTWIAAGVAAGLFAAGLTFTLKGTSIEHQAGTIDRNGVDTGLTRARAVQGLDDVRIGNGLLIGAGVALIAAVTFAVLHARNADSPPIPAAVDRPVALSWTFP
jgi:hypothetical protein